jgi:hypothetical protein
VSKYSGLWEHFVCYAMRTAPLDVDKEETTYWSPLMYFMAIMGIDLAAEALQHAFVYMPY